MYSEQLLDHFKNPRNVGQLDPPAVTVEVSNPICGDILRLSALATDGRLIEVRYQVRGCTASIAAGSALTELLARKTVADAAAILASDIENAVGGLSNESKHAAILAVDAAKALAKKIGTT